MAQNTLPKPKPNIPQDVKILSPDELRDRLLRPLPSPSVRGVIIFLLCVAALSWSLSGTQTSLQTLISGMPAIGNFLVRLFPPEFEYQNGTVRTVLRGGEEFSVGYFDAIATIRPLLLSGETVHIYINERPVPVIARELDRTIGNLRGQEVVRYVVGASGFSIGWPLIINSVIETIQMAIVGTLGAVLLSIPVGLIAARNISPHPAIYQSTRFVLNILRAIPELIYGLIFVAAVGLGPFPGVLAIIFGSVGSLSRLFAEAIEQIDPQQVLAIKATGADDGQTFMYAVIPQAMPLLLSYSLIYFEHNVRNATILGLVGAGGVGFELNKYMALFQYDKMMGAVIVLVVAVTIIDRFSNYIRSRFI